MTKNTVRKATSIIMIASLLIVIAAQALYPIQVASLTSPGNLLYDPFNGDTTLGNIKGGLVSHLVVIMGKGLIWVKVCGFR